MFVDGLSSLIQSLARFFTTYADNSREMIVKERVRLDVGEWSNRAEQIQTQLAQLGVDIKTNDRFVSAMRVLLSNCQVQLNFM